MTNLLNNYLPNEAADELLFKHTFYPGKLKLFLACKMSIDKKAAMICCSGDAMQSFNCSHLCVNVSLSPGLQRESHVVKACADTQQLDTNLFHIWKFIQYLILEAEIHKYCTVKSWWWSNIWSLLEVIWECFVPHLH